MSTEILFAETTTPESPLERSQRELRELHEIDASISKHQYTRPVHQFKMVHKYLVSVSIQMSGNTLNKAFSPETSLEEIQAQFPGALAFFGDTAVTSTIQDAIDSLAGKAKRAKVSKKAAPTIKEMLLKLKRRSHAPSRLTPHASRNYGF